MVLETIQTWLSAKKCLVKIVLLVTRKLAKKREKIQKMIWLFAVAGGGAEGTARRIGSEDAVVS